MKFEVGERVQFVFNGKLVGLGVITEMGENTCIVESEGNQRSYLLGKSEIAKLDQPEPVKVPKETADFIETYGSSNDRYSVLAAILKDIIDCYDPDTDDLFAVLNGYVVEEEKKYIVRVGDSLLFQRFNDNEAVFIVDDKPGVEEQAKVFGNKKEAEKVAEPIGGTVEEVEATK
ncbi:hypothetical protein AAU59_14060 [Listeria monocytogenes]|nr:hypothetical protein [Listeria monocytogenes]